MKKYNDKELKSKSVKDLRDILENIFELKVNTNGTYLNEK